MWLIVWLEQARPGLMHILRTETGRMMRCCFCPFLLFFALSFALILLSFFCCPYFVALTFWPCFSSWVMTDRDWENDEVIFFFNLFKLTFVGCEDIASQLVSGQTSQRLFSQFSPNFVNFFLTFFFQLTPAGCEDIASQLVSGQTGRQFKVILGGGDQHFRQG